MNPAVPQRPDSRIRIGRYAVLGRIGRGGMGMVYRALDEDLEREVALKVLTVEGGVDGENRQRFSVEAKAAAQLQHRNIVTIYELGEAQGFPFIAMELLDGVDLENLMRSGERLLLAEKLEIVGQVCRGLAYAHERHIVHRDIKPSNIRLLDDGVVKIVDFGIAKVAGMNLTHSGMVVGTVHNMSPEQVRGLALDGRSDVFSAGIVLQELLSGARPFEGNSATEVLYKIVHSPAPPLPLPPDAATDRLQRILDRALAKDLEQRYPSAATMADEIAEVQSFLGHAADRQTQERTLEEIGRARRLLREGHTQEAVTHLTTLERAQPECLELRRAQRAAQRQLRQTLSAPMIMDEQEFPELAATFQVRPTERATKPESGKLPRLAVRDRRGLLWLGSALLVLSLLAGGWLLLFSGSRQAPLPLRLSVRSEPPGAAVLVDGAPSGTLTDGELSLDPKLRQITLTLRKAGYQDATRVVTLPLGKERDITLRLAPETAALRIVSEPPGASVSVDGQTVSGRTPLSLPIDRSREHRLALTLEGHASQEQVVSAGL
jgi:predicted Ser/Thr protein kinase